MTNIDQFRLALEAKASDLDAHAAATGSSFFEAVYKAQATILREFSAEVADAAPCVAPTGAHPAPTTLGR